MEGLVPGGESGQREPLVAGRHRSTASRSPSATSILVKAQTVGSENGLYIWNGAAVAMTRSLDASTSSELEQAVTTVEEGTSAGTSWRQSVVNFVLDSGSVTWLQFGAAIGAASETIAGIAEIATQAETDGGTDDLRFVTPLKLNTWANKTRSTQATIGDGSATQFDVNHNFASARCSGSGLSASGNYEQVELRREFAYDQFGTTQFRRRAGQQCLPCRGDGVIGEGLGLPGSPVPSVRRFLPPQQHWPASLRVCPPTTSRTGAMARRGST